ncbi:acyl-CoA thioesterase [Pelosinus sp. UFO1]|uniref:acyl-CoA thioesterase n=1 Tax=Pelosinus sp. UFO1 TaxID=484770 RepID=UPI0004D15C84|nr:hotdog domain-containing protein [Pelosinus sp. UFO1]AIF54251.1 thioesterase superfamily protein [Pelosinus sp. UFO1]
MELKKFITHHLVKGKDLNHHGTLFAGRGAEWFVEAGFVAASAMTAPENTVCLNIHGLVFTRPVPKGSIVRYESKVAYAGRSSMVVYVKVLMAKDDDFVLDGFMTFIHVDENGKSTPHNLVVNPTEIEDIALHQRAKDLLKK